MGDDEGASVGRYVGAEDGSCWNTIAWVVRVASWMESPGAVVLSSRRPPTTTLLPLLVNSVLGTVQAHVVCVVSNEVVLHEMAPNRDGAKVAVDGTRRPQLGVALMPGHNFVNVSDVCKHVKDTFRPFTHVS